MGDAVQTEGHALLKAVSQGKLRLARLLLEGGAYINEGNERGETALSAACTAQYQDAQVRGRMVRYLLEQGADPNMADTAGRTALMHAVHQRAGVHVVSLLLKHGADPGLKDYSGESALTRALVHSLQEDHLGPDQNQPRPDQNQPSPEQNHLIPAELDHNTAQDQDQGLEPSPQSSERSSQDRDRSHRATLQLLLQACESRGQEVLILTCCSEGGHRTIRQYHHTPPVRHQTNHTPQDRHQTNHTPQDRQQTNHTPQDRQQTNHTPQDRHQTNHTPQDRQQTNHTPQDRQQTHRPQIRLSVNGLPPPEQQPTAPASPERNAPAPGPAPDALSAASPSDVHVANANASVNGEGVFSFSVATRPRAPRVRGLKRLNSEPWGLTAPRSALPPPQTPAQDEEEAELPKTPSLADRPQRRHSIETHDSSLGDQLSDKLMNQLMLTDKLMQELTARDELAQELTLTGETLQENSACSEKPAVSEEDAAQTFRRRFNIPSPLPLATLGSSENLSNSSSPLAVRRSRQGAGLLERRGSGTLLLDHLSQPRPGFLPPLFNPQRPIPDIRAINPAPCTANPTPCAANPAPCAANPASKRELRKKKLLRRHSMQPEQMKLLSVFQQVLSENEEK